MIQKIFYTCLGFASIIIWCSNVYFTKSNIDNFGNFTYIGISYTFAGIIGITINYLLEFLYNNKNSNKSLKLQNINNFLSPNSMTTILSRNLSRNLSGLNNSFYYYRDSNDEENNNNQENIIDEENNNQIKISSTNNIDNIDNIELIIDKKESKIYQIEKYLIYIILIINNISIPTSFGLANTNEIVMTTSILTNTWVIILNVLLVYWLGFTVKNYFLYLIGILIGLLGIVISVMGFSFSTRIITLIPTYWYCYLLGIINSLTWSFYSLLLVSNKDTVSNYHPFICFIISGSISIGIASIIGEYKNYNQISFGNENIGVLLYSTLIINTLAYLFWNLAQKYGYPFAISNFSILSPILSIIFISLFYNINLINSNLFGSIFLFGCLGILKLVVSDDNNSNNTR